jgi:CBS domain-containing protein
MSLGRFSRSVVTTSPDELVVDAAQKLRDHRVGCVVLEREGKPYGILTDRDVAIRVVAGGLDARTTKVSQVATLDPVVVRDLEGVETAARRMREYGVRRLPVVDEGGHLRGIITADDLVRILGRELGDLSEGYDASADSTDAR